jgi:hypothetical protein
MVWLVILNVCTAQPPGAIAQSCMRAIESTFATETECELYVEARAEKFDGDYYCVAVPRADGEVLPKPVDPAYP